MSMPRLDLKNTPIVQGNAEKFRQWSSSHTMQGLSDELLSVTSQLNSDLESKNLSVNNNYLNLNTILNDKIDFNLFIKNQLNISNNEIDLLIKFYHTDIQAQMIGLAIPAFFSSDTQHNSLSDPGKFRFKIGNKKFNLNWNRDTKRFELFLTLSNISRVRLENEEKITQKIPGEITVSCELTDSGFELKEIHATTRVAEQIVLDSNLDKLNVAINLEIEDQKKIHEYESLINELIIETQSYKYHLYKEIIQELTQDNQLFSPNQMDFMNLKSPDRDLRFPQGTEEDTIQLSQLAFSKQKDGGRDDVITRIYDRSGKPINCSQSVEVAIKKYQKLVELQSILTRKEEKTLLMPDDNQKTSSTIKLENLKSKLKVFQVKLEDDETQTILNTLRDSRAVIFVKNCLNIISKKIFGSIAFAPTGKTIGSIYTKNSMNLFHANAGKSNASKSINANKSTAPNSSASKLKKDELISNNNSYIISEKKSNNEKSNINNDASSKSIVSADKNVQPAIRKTKVGYYMQGKKRASEDVTNNAGYKQGTGPLKKNKK